MNSQQSCPLYLKCYILRSKAGGGAGIQADLKTFTSFQVYGSSVITAVTSQNTQTVNGIQAMPAEFVKQQYETVIKDIRTDVIKVGRLLLHYSWSYANVTCF
jgi:hydroxymethylpyrimidine kinase/phosphomethylpyrimidine kinase